jgi:hypothetical protein
MPNNIYIDQSPQANLKEMKLKSGKRVLYLIVFVVLTLALIQGLLHGLDSVWTFWKVPMMKPLFGDLRNLTGAAESIRLGLDPLYSNPMDPMQRPLNHPRIVQFIISTLGLNLGSTTLLGIILIILFFVGVFIATPEIPAITAVVIGLAIFSPSIVLGFERANHDLFIFFLVSLTLAFSTIPILSWLTLFLAASIKLFPAFGCLIFLKYPRNTRILTIFGFATAFLTYLIINLKDLPQIFKSTGKSYGLFAYGLHTFSEYGTFHSYIPFFAISIICVFMFMQSIEASGHTYSLRNNNYIDGFRAGAGIFIGTFALGHNYVYRFMFLILAIPQLVAWTKDQDRRTVATLAIAMLLLSFWMPIFGESGFKRWFFVVDEVANWLLYSSMFYLMLGSLPVSLQKWMRLPGDRTRMFQAAHAEGSEET